MLLFSINETKLLRFVDKVMEKHIGRTKADSVELDPVSKSSHVGRMTHGMQITIGAFLGFFAVAVMACNRCNPSI